MFKKLMSAPVRLVLLLIGAIVASMLAIGDTVFESDGNAVTMPITATVSEGQVMVAGGWVGIAGRDQTSGNNVSMDIRSVERSLQVPTALSATVGSIIYIDPTDITGHSVDSTSYTLTGADGLIALMKVTVAQDANDIVWGIMFPDQAPIVDVS